MALAYFNLSPYEFGKIRPAEFLTALNIRNKTVEDDRKHIAELVRGATFILTNLQLKKKINKPSELWKFSWDNDKKKPQKELTEEEKEESLRKLLKAANITLENDGKITTTTN